MKKPYIFICIFLLVSITLFSQSTYKSIIYKAYIENNMKQWKGVIDKMEKTKKNSSVYLMELIEFQYGYISWCIGNERKQEADEYLKLAKINLQKVEKLGGNESIILSYKSAFLGFEIGITPAKAPFIGIKSHEYSKKAMNKGSQIPIVLINYGNYLVHSPSFMGGDKEKAIDIYLRAKKQMELNPKQTKDNWLYLYLLTLIHNAYKKTKNNKMTKFYRNYIFEIEPNFKQHF